MGTDVYDIAIIGGGINGCGIARDAVGRGLSVFLAEKQDLASGTSSASTKLIHGGLRYLEHYEFRLVREALSEREVLWSLAPHIIKPLRFVLPHHTSLRPAWLIRLGLFLYDHLGGREKLPSSRIFNLKENTAGESLDSAFTKAFEYSDCWVDDARLVVLNAMNASERGAVIRTRTEVTSAVKRQNHWELSLTDNLNGKTETIWAKTIVNAAGPWVLNVITDTMKMASNHGVRLVKGSHIVVPRLFDHDRAYIFQNADQRIVFAIPYESDFTLIGTTDVDFQGDPNDAEASAEEIRYLCSSASEYFSDTVSPDDVVWTYSGIRPLYNDGASEAQKATRDYVLTVESEPKGPATVNIFGGKITTYRRLAEDVLKKLSDQFPQMHSPWTVKAPLPGGDFPVGTLDDIEKNLMLTAPGIPAQVAERWARSYGTRACLIAPGATSEQDLGQHFGAGLYACEVTYLVNNEWAVTADDILWRRTKLGLRMTKLEKSALAQWLSKNYSGRVDDAA